MRIATWNIERLKHASKMDKIREEIWWQQANVMVLTEADTRLELPQYPYKAETEPLPQPYYRPTERRVIIHSMHPILGLCETYDPQTACCALLETPRGIIAFYGTIVGIHGNRRASFMQDLKEQVKDWERISATYPLCIVGDLNMTFRDNYYYTKEGRKIMETAFTECNMKCVTGILDETIDHIVLSRSLLPEEQTLSEFEGCGTWNNDKALSDHKGVFMAWLSISVE